MNGKTINAVQSAVTVSIPNEMDMNDPLQFEALAIPTLADFEQYRITDSTAIKEPVPVIKINGETISTEGNITTISGASKSGKSAFTGWIIAGAISCDGNINDPL